MRDYLAIEIKKDVQKAKKRLIAKAKKKGIWEDFGQKEVRELRDKWSHQAFTKQYDILHRFCDWCINFDLSDLEGAK